MRRLVLYLFLAGAPAVSGQTARITLDYPAEGSIFPPEFPAPTLLWRDAAPGVTAWTIEVTFGGGQAALRFRSAGEPMRIGKIDPRCVSPTNKPPQLTAEQAAAHTWKPDAETWAAIKKNSVEAPATVTVTGYRAPDLEHAVSNGAVTLRTSRDPVGAPIFYRDVPLMPSETEKGVIKPLDKSAIPLIAWRLRNVGETSSRLLMTGIHSCANCHSVSARRQDDGHGPGRPPQRQGPVRHLPDPAAGDDPRRERCRLEYVPRQAGREAAGRIHVPGVARRRVCGDHDQRSGGGADRVSAAREPAGSGVQLLCRELQGLPFPSGLLPDARHPGVVQPRHRAAGAAAGRRRSSLRAYQCRVESRRQVPGVRARGSEKRVRRGPQAGGIRQRSQRNAGPIRPLSHSLQRRQRRGGGTGGRGFAERHEQQLSEDLAGRPVDCVCKSPQWPADAAGQ